MVVESKSKSCVNGHDMTAENTYVSPDGVSACRECIRISTKKHYWSNREKRLANQSEWRKRNPDKVKHFAENKRLRTYGLTRESHLEMLKSQGFSCAICKEPQSSNKRKLHIDHDHETGNVRGLLCSRCNTGIGQLRHDLELIESAFKYLSK
jgi:hypothetical protein